MLGYRAFTCRPPTHTRRHHFTHCLTPWVELDAPCTCPFTHLVALACPIWLSSIPAVLQWRLRGPMKRHLHLHQGDLPHPRLIVFPACRAIMTMAVQVRLPHLPEERVLRADLRTSHHDVRHQPRSAGKYVLPLIGVRLCWVPLDGLNLISLCTPSHLPVSFPVPAIPRITGESILESLDMGSVVIGCVSSVRWAQAAAAPPPLHTIYAVLTHDQLPTRYGPLLVQV